MSAKIAKPPIRHHYVPEMLSKRFCDEDDYLHYFDEARARHGIQKVTPSGAFWRRHLNTLETIHGQKIFRIERVYAEQLESRAEPVLEKIVERVRSGKAPQLDAGERDILQHFAIYQQKRPPDAHESMLPDNRFADLADEFKRLQADPTLYFSPTVRERLGTPEFLQWATKTIRTMAVSRPSREIAALLSKLGLYYLVARGGLFAICSNPVLKVRDGSLGGEKGKGVFHLPIASDVAIAFGPSAMNGNTYACTFADKLNQLTILQSSAVAACQRSMVEALVAAKAKLVNPEQPAGHQS